MRWFNRRGPHAAVVGVAVLMAVGMLAGFGGSKSSLTTKAPHRGGTLTVLEAGADAGAWPSGLDPATDSTALGNATEMDAIYGELFQLAGKTKVIPDLATSYAFSNGDKTLTLHIRPGVTFTDGTPLDAAAVVSNLNADLAGDPLSRPSWPLGSITATGTDTVVVQFTTPDGAAANQIQGTNFNWIASPAAEAKLGLKKFAIDPVGAGPFEVVSDTPSSKLVLKANPTYWQKGHPYLSGLVFESTSSDETALEALESGAGQAYEDMGTVSLVKSFKSQGYKVTTIKATSTGDVQLNTEIPPFNNILAREAIYYGLNIKEIETKLDDGDCTTSESFTGPAALFYFPSVPGYRTYNLAKAKALVKQLGGLSFTLEYFGAGATPLAETEQTMFDAAGMHVKLLEEPDLTAWLEEYATHKWQATPLGIGSWDPSAGTGVAAYLQTGVISSGVNDPKVDALMAEAQAPASNSARATIYKQLAEYLSQKAYVPFICSGETWNIATKGVEGPGLTSPLPSFAGGITLTPWQDISMNNS
jgi:peptide/nickel transport system substrate-binding protein